MIFQLRTTLYVRKSHSKYTPPSEKTEKYKKKEKKKENTEIKKEIPHTNTRFLRVGRRICAVNLTESTNPRQRTSFRLGEFSP